MTTTAPTSYAGAPPFDVAWRSIALGRWSFPPVPGQDSTIDVETEESLKVDQQKASGKDKAKTKENGIDVSKGKGTIEWTVRIWDEARAFMIGISPNGPDKGGPFDGVHPEWNDRGVSSIMVTKMGKLERKPGGRVYKQSFDWEEWVDPGTASTGAGTKTPDKSDPFADGPDDGAGTAAKGGFDGANAPQADYTSSYGGKHPGDA